MWRLRKIIVIIVFLALHFNLNIHYSQQFVKLKLAPCTDRIFGLFSFLGSLPRRHANSMLA